MAKNRSNLFRFLRMFMPYRFRLMRVLAVALSVQALALIFPQLVRLVMDEVIQGKSGYSEQTRIRILFGAAAAIFAVALLFGIIHFIRINMLQRLLWRIIFDLRQTLNWHLQRLSLAFYARQRIGRLVSRLISDINQVSALVNQGAVNLVLDLIMIAAILVILLVMNPLLCVLSIIVMPVYFWTLFTLNPKIRLMSKVVQRKVAVMSGGINERLSGMSVIQSFCSEEAEHRHFTIENEQYTQRVLKYVRLNAMLQGLSVTIVYAGNAIVLCAGGYLTLRGNLTGGEVVAFMLYLPLLYGPLSRLADINVAVQQSLGSMDRVFDILDITPEIENDPEPVMSMDGPGHIRFDNVQFRYNTSRPVLYDIDLTVEPGHKIALIGPSGSGKSTLASLIPRLYDVTEGAIRIDGVDIRKIHLNVLRGNIGIVQQEPFLFSTTIRENILYGRPDASQSDIIEAARAANALEFIEKLPLRFDTPTGERGVSLSVGQRQRICLARTILKNPKILILDEATSALDSESENLVREAMDHLMNRRTSVIIAHRLSTVMNADRVLVIREGRIVEQGTHTRLWQKGGFYRHLLEQQFEPMKQLVEKAGRGEE